MKLVPYVGDFAEDSTIYIPFNTVSNADPSASVTITDLVAADIKVHKDGNLTPIATDGATVVINFGGITGNHLVTIDTSVDAAYTVGSDYIVRLEGTTVAAATINVFVASFSVENRSTSVLSAGIAARSNNATLETLLGVDDDDSEDTLVFQTWEEILQGNTHNVNNSAGRTLRQASSAILGDGILQSATADTAVLEVGDVTNDGILDHSALIISSGTGVGQERVISDSVASTDTVTITPSWVVTPDNTSEYSIIPAAVHASTINGGYDGGAVWVDTVNGTAGTFLYVNGTITRPVSNIEDAFTIAAALNIQIFEIHAGSTISLPADSTFRSFRGRSYAVLLNNANIEGVRFEGASLSGIATGGSQAPNFVLCGIGTVTLPPCNGFQVGFFGTFTIGSEGAYTFGGSASVFGIPLTLDYGAGLNSSNFFLQTWGGGAVILQNAGAGTGTYRFDMAGLGDLTLEASCSDTLIIDLHGHLLLTNNSDVVTITKTANFRDTELLEIGVAGAGLTDLGGMSSSMITEVKNAILPPQNVALPNIEFLFVAASDHVTPVTGATGISVERSIDGSSFAAGTGTVTEVSNGIYQYDASQADMNGGIITFRFIATGGTPGAPDDRFLTLVTGGAF